MTYYHFLLLLLMILSAISFTVRAQKAEVMIDNGDVAYKAGKFQEAQNWYEQAIANNASAQFPEIVFNLGNALFQQKKYLEAGNLFNKLAEGRTDATLRSASYYNAGNSFLAQKNYAAALSAFKNSLRLNPRDEDARYNLTLTNALIATQQGSANKTAAQKPKEILQAPPQENLTPEQQRKLLDELNAAENKTIEQFPKKVQQKKKNVKDW